MGERLTSLLPANQPRVRSWHHTANTHSSRNRCRRVVLRRVEYARRPAPALVVLRELKAKVKAKVQQHKSLTRTRQQRNQSQSRAKTPRERLTSLLLANQPRARSWHHTANTHSSRNRCRRVVLRRVEYAR